MKDLEKKLLVERYFALRHESALHEYTPPFEGKPWREDAGMLVRDADDGQQLRLYRIEDDIEVCVVSVDGTSHTFC